MNARTVLIADCSRLYAISKPNNLLISLYTPFIALPTAFIGAVMPVNAALATEPILDKEF